MSPNLGHLVSRRSTLFSSSQPPIYPYHRTSPSRPPWSIQAYRHRQLAPHRSSMYGTHTRYARSISIWSLTKNDLKSSGNGYGYLNERSTSTFSVASVGAGAGAASASASRNSRTGEMPRRDLSKELESGIGIWSGPSIFSGASSSRVIRADSPEDFRTPIKASHSQGTSDSPISISSSSPSPPSSQARPLSRPRAVPHFSSPLPRTAFTPPREAKPVFPPSPFISRAKSTEIPPWQSTGNNDQRSEKEKQQERAIHPFFARPRTAPPQNRPRLVATYSSTSASASASASASDFTSSQSQSQRSTGSTRQNSTSTTTGWEAEMTRLADQVEKLDVASRSSTKRRPLVVPPRLPMKASSQTPSSSSHTRSHVIARPNSNNNQLESLPPGYSVPPKTAPLPLFHYRHSSPPPQIVYTTSPTEANDLLGCLKGNVFGFDLEWPPAGKYMVVQPDGSVKPKMVAMTWNEKTKKYDFGQGRTALVQICDERLVVLIHLGESMELPSKVVEIIRDPTIYKLGVQVKGDGLKLLRDFPHLFAQPGASAAPCPSPSPSAAPDPATAPATAASDSRFPKSPKKSRPTGPSGLLELSYLARAVDAIATGPGHGLIKLSTLCSTYLGKELEKPDDVRRGNWFGSLGARERDYAANDVYSSLMIYKALVRKAEEQDMSLNMDRFCSALHPRPIGGAVAPAPASASATAGDSGSASRTSFTAGTGVDADAAYVYVGDTKYPLLPGTAKAPGPSQLNALAAFMGGMGVEDIAESRSVRRSTVEHYILNSLQALGPDILRADQKERLRVEIPTNGWSWNRFPKLRQAFGIASPSQARAVAQAEADVMVMVGSENKNERKDGQRTVSSASGAGSGSESEEVEEVEVR